MGLWGCVGVAGHFMRKDVRLVESTCGAARLGWVFRFRGHVATFSGWLLGSLVVLP